MKRKKENERWEKEMRNIKTEQQVWEVVNRERGKRKGGGVGIEIEKWEEYFKTQFGSVEWRMVKGERIRKAVDGEEDVKKGEVEKVLKNMKDGKSAGGDGIPAEIWKYGGKRMKEWVFGIYKRIWKGEGWIREWEEGIIVPVLKKGEGKKVEEYREVTLTATLYKIYAGGYMCWRKG